MQYTWFIWSLILILIWIALYASPRSSKSRREMLIVSLWTSLLGFTEPLFVPAYWLPPSLFNLAARTHFDIESLIFSFGIGGIAAFLYNHIFRRKEIAVPASERHAQHHRYHLLAILSAPAILILLLLITRFNPIYSSITAMIVGGLATWYCRPDLKKKMFVSAFLFLILYFLYFLVLVRLWPGYVQQVWNLKAISGILIFGVPLEELLFAASFGFLWSSIYEHFSWHKIN